MSLTELKDIIITITLITTGASTIIWMLIRDKAIKLVKSEVNEMESRVMKAIEQWKKEAKEEDETREKRAKEDREAYREAFKILSGRIDRVLEKHPA